MEVCPLSRGVILPGSATPIRLITKRPSLFHPPLPILPSTRLTACFPGPGEVRVYHVPQLRLDGLGLAYTPVAQRLR